MRVYENELHGRGVRQNVTEWSNRDTSEGFATALAECGSATATIFHYSRADLKLLHLTRGLARLSIDRATYKHFFGTDPLDDFPTQFDALERARLVRCDAGAIELTPEGMFYADAVAGLLAHVRVVELRDGEDDRAVRRQHMG